MPEATQQQTNIVDAKADDELELGTVVSWNGRYAFVRPDRGGPDCYVGTPELARAGIERLKIGVRVSFEVRQATHHRKPWAARIRIAGTTP
jgi:cold shock CspA family protein